MKKKIIFFIFLLMSWTSLSSMICNADINRFSMCLSNNNFVYSFGYCADGVYGHKQNFIFPPKQIEGLENIKIISCNLNHSVCIDFDGNIFTLGENSGQLEIGDYLESHISSTHIPQKLKLPPITQVSCGIDFTICLSEEGILYSFGKNFNGQLGLSHENTSHTPQQIPDLNNIAYIVCGGYHSICKSNNDEYYSWGHNMYGQLGRGKDITSSKPTQCLDWPGNIIDIKVGFHFTLLLTEEGNIYTFGRNNYGQLGINNASIIKIYKPILIKNIPEIQKIQCGYNHSMCIDINDNLWLFGQNKYAQLGLGDKKDRFIPTKHSTLVDIMDLSSGGFHTFVKTLDNKIYAFGNNNQSQLGIKTSNMIQLTPIQVFIDNEDIWCSTIGKSKQKSARK